MHTFIPTSELTFDSSTANIAVREAKSVLFRPTFLSGELDIRGVDGKYRFLIRAPGFEFSDCAPDSPKEQDALQRVAQFKRGKADDDRFQLVYGGITVDNVTVVCTGNDLEVCNYLAAIVAHTMLVLARKRYAREQEKLIAA